MAHQIEGLKKVRKAYSEAAGLNEDSKSWRTQNLTDIREIEVRKLRTSLDDVKR